MLDSSHIPVRHYVSFLRQESDTEPNNDRFTADRPIRSNFGDSHKLLSK